MSDYERYCRQYQNYVIMHTPGVMQDFFGAGNNLEPPLPPMPQREKPKRRVRMRSTPTLRKRVVKLKAKDWSMNL